MLLLGGVQTADTGPDVDPDVVAVFSLQVQPGILERSPTGINAEVGETVGSSHFFGTGEGRHRIEVANFRSNLAIEGGNVEGAHAPDTTFSGQDVFPDGIGIQPQRGGTTQTGHNHAAFRPSIRHSSGTGYPASADTQARVNLGGKSCLRSVRNEKGQLRRPGCPDERGLRVTWPENPQRA